jgi:hypothetical protein
MKISITLRSGETVVSDTPQLTLKNDSNNPGEVILCLGPYVLAAFDGVQLSNSPLSPKPETEIANVTRITV